MAEDSIYLRMFQRAWTFTYETKLNDDGVEVPEHKTMKRTIADPLLVEAYDLMMRMRGALQLCVNQFDYYADQHEKQRGGYTTIVETQQLEEKIQRNRGIANELSVLLAEHVTPVTTEWLPIATANHENGKPIRLLGKTKDGQPYIETSYWRGEKWAIESVPGFLPPTHWQKLEVLPDGY